MKLSIMAAVGVMGWGLTAVGCAGGKDAAEVQMDKFRSEVGRLRAENAVLEQRIGNLEARTSRSAKRPANPSMDEDSMAAGTDERPELEIVRLAPPEPVEEADVAAKAAPSDNARVPRLSPAADAPAVIEVKVTK